MKRFLSGVFICSYLSILMYGIVCHTLSMGVVQHPGMYYIVWDMFCGWDAFGNKFHVFGEGESGKYYELAPGPWGDFLPYGNLGRQHYDTHMAHMHKFALNSLKHSTHEPMVKVHVIEEFWSKKFDFPEYLWKAKFEVPREPTSYCHLRYEFDPEGRVMRRNTSWFEEQVAKTFNNPRMMADMRSNRSGIIISSGANSNSGVQRSGSSPVSLLGN